jgi:hypothetical protein
MANTQIIVDGKKVVNVVQGSHLTVMTLEDGTTSLKWDDAALMRDVQEAIAGLGNLVEVTEQKVKKSRKKKEA